MSVVIVIEVFSCLDGCFVLYLWRISWSHHIASHSSCVILVHVHHSVHVVLVVELALLSLAFKFFELLCLVLLRLTQISQNYHQLSQTFQIFRVLVDYVFLVFESLLVISHSSVARSHHQSPFHFSRLYLTCSFEKDAGFLVEIVLDLVAPEPGNGVKHHRLEAERLQKLLEGLRLVFLLEIQVGQTHQHVRVRTDLGHQDVVPLHGVT